MPLCEFSGRSRVVKNLVSHSNIKTKSKALINVHRKTFYSLVLKRSFRAMASTRALRSIDKAGGVDVFLIKQKDKKLSAQLLKMKKKLIKKMKIKKEPIKKGALKSEA